MNNEEILEKIVRDAENWCEPAQSLRIIIDALISANLQLAEEDEDSQELVDKKYKAEELLFKIANHYSNGYREKNEEFNWW